MNYICFIVFVFCVPIVLHDGLYVGLTKKLQGSHVNCIISCLYQFSTVSNQVSACWFLLVNLQQEIEDNDKSGIQDLYGKFLRTRKNFVEYLTTRTQSLSCVIFKCNQKMQIVSLWLNNLPTILLGNHIFFQLFFEASMYAPPLNFVNITFIVTGGRLSNCCGYLPQSHAHMA